MLYALRPAEHGDDDARRVFGTYAAEFDPDAYFHLWLESAVGRRRCSGNARDQTTYNMAGDGKPNWKQDYKGSVHTSMIASRRHYWVGAVHWDVFGGRPYGHVDYYYDSVPFTTTFRARNRQGQVGGNAVQLRCNVFELHV